MTIYIRRRGGARAKSVLGKDHKVKLRSLPQLEKDLRDILYPLIKKRDGPVCISCGKNITKSRDCQAGHFAKSELCNMLYRYDERNINTQCGNCNKWKAGAVFDYEKAMIKKYGAEITQEIKDNYKSPLPLDFNKREYLLRLIDKYSKIEKLDSFAHYGTL